MRKFLYARMLVLVMSASGVSGTTARAVPAVPAGAEPVVPALAEPVAPAEPVVPAEPVAPALAEPVAPADGGMLLEEEAAPGEPLPLAFAPATDHSAEQHPIRPLDVFWGYRTVEHASSWMVGDGNQFGDYSFSADYHQPSGITSGFGLGFELHFLAGPKVTDMPPRVFNFSLGYQRRKQIGRFFTYDVSAAVMAASDFEGSSRRGIRFPAHAVGYFAIDPTLDLALGADFLDREDLHILPVAGFIWRPDPDVRVELLFPRPRIDFQLTDRNRLFLRGGLGGGTWAVERDGGANDLATYYDLQIGIGLDCRADHSWQSFEIAYLFDRKLEFASQVGDYQPAGTVMIRTVSRY